ncbi:hypothetical protein [Nocardioides dongkuii]|uniref:hypothetical protein n=1 Tax=Nocardioides dongkuii TaxID=2760089 RepID=UPI0015FC4D01|nr:hypothetical protein [Nocardioides dongkuii]
MPLPRRALLRCGAAAAIAAAATSCRDAPDGSGTPTPTPAAPPSTRAGAGPGAAPHTPAWAGEPPPGTLYLGASLPYGRPLRAWERELGSTLSVHRSYFRPDPNETAQLVWRCRDDLAHQRLPHVSTKPPGSWRDVAAGHHDPWLGDILRRLGRLDAPIFFTVHHEPENDAGAVGMQARDFVAMQRHVIDLAARAAPQVSVVPVIQHWSFEPLRGAVDPTAWIVEEAPMLGIDVYNPWSPTNGKSWRSFGSRVDEVVAWTGERPLAIGEFGSRDDPTHPGAAAQWLRDAAAYARSSSIVSMSYFNSGVKAPDGSLEMNRPTEQAFAELLAAEWVARPV